MVFPMKQDKQAELDKYDLSSEARVEANAKTKGVAILWPKENELFLDLDSEAALFEAQLRVERLREIVPGLRIVKSYPSRTVGHHHMVVTCDGPLDEEGRVFLELALGSDPKRALLGMHELVEHGRDRVSCFFETST